MAWLTQTTGRRPRSAAPRLMGQAFLLARRTARLQTASFAALWLAVGCSSAPPGQAPAPGPAAQPGKQLPGPLTSDQKTAVELAQSFLAGQKTDWGNPVKVDRDPSEVLPAFRGESVYRVTYPTPDNELPLLGERGVIVDLKTRRAAYVPRD